MSLPKIRLLFALVLGPWLPAGSAAFSSTEPAQVLTNQLGYEPGLPKHAVIRGHSSDRFSTFLVKTYPEGGTVLEGKVTPVGPVDHWRNWAFGTVDFDSIQAEGSYQIECADGPITLRSFPFRIQKGLLERSTLSDVIYYFKGQRCSGALDQADRTARFLGPLEGTVDLHGGWYDATGDFGKHFSQLSFSSYFNSQQIPLVDYSLFKAYERLRLRGDRNFTQYERRLLDEGLYGADYLVRTQDQDKSFYESVNNLGAGKKPEDRRIAPTLEEDAWFNVHKAHPEKSGAIAGVQGARDEDYLVSYRGGGGMAIAALAMASRSSAGGDFPPARYLKTAETAFRYLQSHNLELLNDGRENIVDDYCALLGATELFRATGESEYGKAAQQRAENLLARLKSDGEHRNYWSADAAGRPFFHSSDAGLPLVSLLYYRELASPQMQARITEAVRRSLEFELDITNEVANPFGLARQYVQATVGGRHTSFFFPHDNEAAPWWQGENGRLASLAFAARLASPLYHDDAPFQRRLQAYAVDQLNWILGLNPFDTCMLQGTGRNNPEYLFFGTYQYHNAPGGICNGITSGFTNQADIDFNIPYEVSGGDYDWRWGEQWLPHDAWYMLAVAQGSGQD